jgi:hypothetical protein
MKKCFLVIFVLVSVSSVQAQDKEKLFNAGQEKHSKKGVILNADGDFDLPGGDMAKRFGASYRLGPSVSYKTGSNWIFGAKIDFVLGGKVKEDSLMINVRDKYSTSKANLYEFIDNNGNRIGVPVYERGFAMGLEAGRIFALSKDHPDNGLLLMTTVGLLQHKILIYDKDKAVSQLRGDYLKGYDRLTNGLFLEEYAGYIYFARNGLLNFTLGVDAMFGFTQGRRDYLYDVMRPDTKQRLDILFGIRGGWFIPIFRKKSEEMMFE